jgi:hypothetical protein
MSKIASFSLPSDGEIVVCNGVAYEWDVVEEVNEHFERWGWLALCPACDLQKVYGVTSACVVQSLPVFL